MRIIESYWKWIIVDEKNELYRVEWTIDQKKINQEISIRKNEKKVFDNKKYENEIKYLKDKWIILDIKQVYIKGYPEVYAFMAPICCPHWEHPDIAWWISMDKEEALHKTIWEAIERYYLFNFVQTDEFKKINMFSYMKKLWIWYFSSSQAISKKIKKISNVWMWNWYSLINNREIKMPYSFVHCPYKTVKWEDFIWEWTSTWCSAHRTRELAILNGIMECIERHVNMKIRYNKITPPEIILDSIDDDSIQYMIKLLKSNWVKIHILNTTNLNDYWVPSVMIVCKNNSWWINSLITSSCKATLKWAISKSLEEAFQGQTRWFLMNKYPNFKPWRNYSNVRYFYQHVLFYANKNNEKYLKFLFDKTTKEKYKNIGINNSLNQIKKILKDNSRDCYIVDFKCDIPWFFVNKVFLPWTYQLSRDHSQRFLSNVTKSYNKYPYPFW